MDYSNPMTASEIKVAKQHSSEEVDNVTQDIGLMSFVAIIGLFLLIQGCDIIEEDSDYDYVTNYDIEVTNDTFYTLNIYCDGDLEFSLGGYSSKTIYGVSSGTHTLEATWIGVTVAERSVYVDSDLVWTISS